MRGQERQVILAAVGVYDDGCGKTAIDGQDRRGGEAIEMECLLLITQQDQFLVRTGIALRIVKSDAQRHHHRLFCVLSRSEEHTSELQSLMSIPSAVFCLKKKQ